MSSGTENGSRGMEIYFSPFWRLEPVSSSRKSKICVWSWLGSGEDPSYLLIDGRPPPVSSCWCRGSPGLFSSSRKDANLIMGPYLLDLI